MFNRCKTGLKVQSPRREIVCRGFRNDPAATDEMSVGLPRTNLYQAACYPRPTKVGINCEAGDLGNTSFSVMKQNVIRAAVLGNDKYVSCNSPFVLRKQKQNLGMFLENYLYGTLIETYASLKGKMVNLRYITGI